jgi:hypothetical protein
MLMEPKATGRVKLLRELRRISLLRIPVNRAEKWKSRDSVLDCWPE